MNDSRDERGKTDRLHVASGELLNLSGMTHQLHVAKGGVARIQGMVTGQVEVEQGGVAIVQGMVTDIIGNGYVWVGGMVNGTISQTVSAEFHPNAPNPTNLPTKAVPTFGWPEGEPPPEVLTIDM